MEIKAIELKADCSIVGEVTLKDYVTNSTEGIGQAFSAMFSGFGGNTLSEPTIYIGESGEENYLVLTRGETINKYTITSLTDDIIELKDGKKFKYSK